MELKTSLGDNKTLDIPLTWEGAPFSPVTGDTLIFTVKAAPTDADASALIQKITGGGGITFSGRTATVTLLHADTADLEPATTYFDIQHQDGVTGAVKTLTPPGSRLELKRDITRETTTSVTVVSNEPGSPGGPPQVKSSNFTAANNVTYHTTASLTITDPTPVEGRGYTVLVLAGTTTIGGVGYSVAGTFLNRVYEDGEWTTYNQSTSGSGDVSGPASAVSNNFAAFDQTTGKLIKDSGSNAESFATAAQGTDERVPTAAGLTDKFSTNKATIADNDRVAILDSEASNVPKHTLWSLVKSTLKTYFDTLYALATHTHSAADITSGTLSITLLPVGTGAAQVASGDHVHTGVYQPVGSYATLTNTETLTNKRIPPRVTTIASSGTPTINSDNCDMVTITAQAEAITSMTSSLTGTPNNGEMLLFRIKDDGTARAITWGASFKAFGAALPTTTVLSKTLHSLFIWDSVDSKWGCLSTSQEA